MASGLGPRPRRITNLCDALKPHAKTRGCAGATEWFHAEMPRTPRGTPLHPSCVVWVVISSAVQHRLPDGGWMESLMRSLVKCASSAVDVLFNGFDETGRISNLWKQRHSRSATTDTLAASRLCGLSASCSRALLGSGDAIGGRCSWRRGSVAPAGAGCAWGDGTQRSRAGLSSGGPPGLGSRFGTGSDSTNGVSVRRRVGRLDLNDVVRRGFLLARGTDADITSPVAMRRQVCCSEVPEAGLNPTNELGQYGVDRP